MKTMDDSGCRRERVYRRTIKGKGWLITVHPHKKQQRLVIWLVPWQPEGMAGANRSKRAKPPAERPQIIVYLIGSCRSTEVLSDRQDE
ncbi:hypothetical protein [Pseudomonas fluorescens]|uniref:Transposase n=1 Tax=Pseudomonas fluorescens TaxID=294 RepID=A0A944DLN3_PSEFL|nr:hypothetical protein [Pseudomonas fluorescens]MBT2296279.1 hypothetical protein [Pseudomonas fluorescens]MBT2308616.1 hypothetical protein [Pseudomonas fluorescens]MBT2312605.1 hypothetical protein [Pseudomonas fluorescens]MBT2317734.1 hypothetical protein [Pseudomonas fluorescens]MBT2328070.1 hypothetical protein [Pseudomonas fluorescens]